MVIEKADPAISGVILYTTNWIASPAWSTPSDGTVSFELYTGPFGNQKYHSTYTETPFTIPTELRGGSTFGLRVVVGDGTNYRAGRPA